MLFVSGKQIDDFNNYLDKCWTDCPIVALFLAVATFDWIARRLLLSLSQSPSADVRKALGIPFDIESFEGIWNNECKQSITDFVRDEATKLAGDSVVANLSWDKIKNAYQYSQALRLEGVDGDMNSTVRCNVELLFGAVRLFDAYASRKEIELSKQICKV